MKLAISQFISDQLPAWKRSGIIVQQVDHEL